MQRKTIAETIANAIRLLESLDQRHTSEYQELVKTWEAMRNSQWTVAIPEVEVYS